MAAKPTWSVVRELLSANMALTADEVITRAKAKGVSAPDDVIRTTVHNVRKKLKQKAAGPAKVAPAAARQTAAPVPVSPVVRAILADAPDLPADAVIAKAKAKGVTAPDDAVRKLVHNIRSELRKAGAKPAPTAPATKSEPAPMATTKPTATKPEPTPVVPSAPAPSPSVGLTGVLSNVALVNAAVATSGGVEQVRQVAEAVRACGGVDAFAEYLDLVAGIRTGGA
ncbi:hypothetical protein J0H58_32675 [bacterium]|nr:hypothetical protein [bacterium]